MPGNALAGALADSSLIAADERPGDLLLSGRGLGDDPTFVDRAGTAAYQSGAADYAGINFRVGTDGAVQGSSYLAGAGFNYPLRGNAKYYARKSGVSGVHEATPGSISGTFRAQRLSRPRINGLQFSFLDSAMKRSLVTGSFDFGAPTNLKLDFENLNFTCNGGLESVTLPPSNGREVSRLLGCGAHAAHARVQRGGRRDLPSEGRLRGHERGRERLARRSTAAAGSSGFTPRDHSRTAPWRVSSRRNAAGLADRGPLRAAVGDSARGPAESAALHDHAHHRRLL